MPKKESGRPIMAVGTPGEVRGTKEQGESAASEDLPSEFKALVAKGGLPAPSPSLGDYKTPVGWETR